MWNDGVIRGVIFDMGGTLIGFRYAPDWRSFEGRGIAALYHFLVGRGYALQESEFHEAMWDVTSHGWREAVAGRGNVRLPDVIVEAVARLGVVLDEETRTQAVKVYTTGVGEDAFLLDGARQVLSELKGRGLRLGLLSNTMWPGQIHSEGMSRLGLIEFFDVLVFSGDVGLWKPNAPAFHYVTDRLGVSPAEAVFVGDHLEADVLGAQNAGLRAVWITASNAESGDVHPDAIIYRLAELPAALDQIGRL
jgi:HAD superfamily hydrolase (TIGR01509 family)